MSSSFKGRFASALMALLRLSSSFAYCTGNMSACWISGSPALLNASTNGCMAGARRISSSPA
ncbi:MAG TPA: hypothetical protein VN731_00630 [Rhodanobacter sp.]|nr:hypothetical protein [Rhodanobacter sp.]